MRRSRQKPVIDTNSRVPQNQGRGPADIQPSKLDLRRGRLKASLIRLISIVLHCGISVTLIFAFARFSATLGLQYHVGYEILPIDLVLIANYTDLLIWFWGTVAIAVLAFLVALVRRSRERWAYTLFSASMFLPIAVYLNQQPFAAYSASLILQVLFIVLITIFARRFRLGTQLEGTVTALSLLVILAGVELGSLFRHVQNVWNPSLPLITLQAQLSGLAFNIASPLMLAALFTWVAIIPLAVRNVLRRSTQETAKEAGRNTRLVSFLLLLLALVVSVLVALSPYASASPLRGVDTRIYYNALSSIHSFADFLTAFRVDNKPLCLLFFYAIEVFTGWNPFLVTISGPAALAVLLVIVSYLFILGVTRNWLAAGFSGMLAAVSFQVTVGLYAGIFANLLAMSFVLLVLYFLSAPLTKFRAVLLILASYAVLLAHAWTWGIMMGAVGVSTIFYGLLWLGDKKSSALKGSVVAHSLLLLCGSLPVMAVYLGSYLSLLSPGIAASLTNALNFEVGSMSIAHLSGIMPSLSATLTRIVGAIFAYPLTLALTVVGFIFLAKTNVRAIGPFVGLSVVTSVSALVMDLSFQWRLLYLIPFQALAAVGVMASLWAVEWIAARVGIDPTTRSIRLCEVLLVGVILIDSVNYALSAVAYLPTG